jgi:hypothetical protein
MIDITKRHARVLDLVRRAIEENMAERLLSKIGDNIVIREEGLSKEMRSLRRDLNFVTKTFGSSSRVPIVISYLSGCTSYGVNTLEKVCIDKKEKHKKLAQETRNIREMNMEIISIIASSLGAIHAG